MRTCSLLVLACLAALPAHAAPATHVLPLWMQGGHPTIAVQLGDSVEPLHFVVDSAAGATVMDQATARRLGMEDPDAVGVAVEGATDSSALLRRTRSTRWQMGSLSFEAATMHTDLSRLGSEDGRRIDGIVGNDITDAFDTTYDIAGQQLLLQPPGTLKQGSACAPNALPDRDASMRRFGFIRMQLGSAGIEAIAVVDTGAAQTVLNGAAATALNLRIDGSDARVRVRAKGTRGLGEQVMPTWLTTLPALGMGSWRHPPLEVRISELPVFASLGLKDGPALILGADAIADTRLQIGSGAGWICLRRK